MLAPTGMYCNGGNGLNKEELTALVAEILRGSEAPAVKSVEPERVAADVSNMDLRKLYMVKDAADGERFRKMKLHTPARLGCGKAGARYKTLTMLRFRADHAAAQDAVFSQVAEDFAEENGMVAVRTKCEDKDQYLTRPDLGRCFDEENAAKIREAVLNSPKIQIVVGDGLSSAAITANAMDCLSAIRDGLKLKGMEIPVPIFVRYCRVGAGDAVGDITGCELVCVLVGERPGLATDKSMSAYITYKPHIGVSESARTVISNIHDGGTPAVEAGAHIAELIEMILKRKVSGVGLHLEAGA